MERDALEVAREYPDLKLVVCEKDERAQIIGTITHREEKSRVATLIPLRIELRSGYPEKEPVAYETAGQFVHGNLDGHVLSDGQLCLWLPPRSQWDGSDPHALLKFVDQILLFADRHLVWKETGNWPGGASAHGDLGWVEFIHEQLCIPLEGLEGFAEGFGKEDGLDLYNDCPCGSGAKYRFCHREKVRNLRRICERMLPIKPPAFAKMARGHLAQATRDGEP